MLLFYHEVIILRIFSFLICLLLLTGCAAKDPDPETIFSESTIPITETDPTETTIETEPLDLIGDMIAQMSVEERVGQLFLARCDSAYALDHIQEYHLGGFVLFGADFRDETRDTMIQKIQSYQAAAKLPLLIAVDEEGGTVTRVSSYPAFRENKFSSIRDLYKGGGLDWVFYEEEQKCQLLSTLGLNVNLGPVCDMTTDPNAFMYKRSLGQDVFITSDYVSGAVGIMNDYQIGSCLKHFPGYGNNTDTHTGIAVDRRSLTELEDMDLLPFAAGIAADCGAVMVSHTIVECLDAELPASLSTAVHHYLRQRMGFEGVIMTDDLVMQAITERYGAGEAAVLAVLAGNDLLCSTDYITQYEAVLTAVLDGRIAMDTLDNAVRNVLEWKQQLGLILVG